MCKNGIITRSGARRYGDDYQDLIAAEAMIKLLERPDLYSYVRLEVEDAGQLDDVVLHYRPENFRELCQVKYSLHSNDEDDYYSWEKLTHRPQGRRGLLSSLLGKWISSFFKCKSQGSFSATLKTNRRFDLTMLTAYNTTSKAISFERVPNEYKQLLNEEYFSDEMIKEFFDNFIFEVNYTPFDILEEQLSHKLQGLGCAKESFNSLKNAIRCWVRQGTKEIDLGMIRDACNWHRLHNFNENFVRPDDYIVPSNSFHSKIMGILSAKSQHRCIIIEAPPGMGKSSYISYLTDVFRKEQHPFIRHHYFLGLEHNTSLRIDHKKVLESLMDEMRRYCSKAVSALDTKNCTFEDFPDWYKACSNHYKDSPVIISIDGLDHVLRNQNNIDEINRLLNFFFPVPQGVVLLIGSQPLPQEHTPTCFSQYAGEILKRGLPPWDRTSLKSWLSNNEILSQALDEDHNNLDNFIEELYRVGEGHPLISRYIVQALMDTHSDLNFYRMAQDISSCFASNVPKDLNEYYNFIIGKISTCATHMLKMVAASNWSWPDGELVNISLLAKYTRDTSERAWESIKHLFQKDYIGWRPIHESFLLYLKIQFPDSALSCSDILNNWLNSSAPAYWQWRYRASTSKDYPCLNKVWCIESYYRGYPEKEISMLLMNSASNALRNGNIKDFAKQTLWYEYTSNKYNFYDQRLLIQHWREIQLLIGEEALLPQLLLRDKAELSPQELQILIIFNTDNEEIVDKLSCELIDRYNNHINSKRANRENIEQLEEALIRTTGIRKHTNISKFLEYLNSNQSHAQKCIQAIWANENSDLLSKFLDDANAQDTLKELISKYALLRSVETGQDISCINNYIPNTFSFFRELHVNNQQNDNIEYPPVHPPIDRLNHQPFDGWLLDTLFFISGHYFLTRDCIIQWLESASITNAWQQNFFMAFYEACSNLSDTPLIDIQYMLCSGLQNIAKPELRDDDAVYLWQALFRVWPDFMIYSKILTTTSSVISITKRELEAAFQLSFCYWETWLERYLKTRRNWLSAEEIEYLAEQFLMTPVENDGQHGKQAVLIALLNARSGYFEAAKAYLRQSINQYLSYGWHKDTLLDNYIEAGQLLRDEDIPNRYSSLFNGALTIQNFTDDCNVTKEYAKLLIKKWPTAFSSYYNQLVSSYEYYDSEQVFNEFCLSLPLDSNIQIALARTNLSSDFLNEIQKNENSVKNNILFPDEQYIYSGSQSKSYQPTNSDYSGSNRQNEISIEVMDYPPEGLRDFWGQIESSYTSRDTYLFQWCEYWEANANLQEVADALIDLISNTHKSNLAPNVYMKIYQYTKRLSGNDQAWEWLIKYFIAIHGWSGYYMSIDAAREAWNIVISIYPERWMSFLQETMLGTVNKLDISMWGNISRFAEYFNLMGKYDVVIDLMDGCREVLENLLSPYEIDTSSYCPEESNFDNTTLDLLLKRLEWPSSLVREQACKELSSLLRSPQYSDQVHQRLIDWISQYPIESIALLGMFPLLRAHKDNVPLMPINITRSGPVSLAFSELTKKLPLDSCIYPTTFEDAPVDFYPPQAFLDNYENTLPHIYYERAKKIERYGIDFTKQWSWEFSKIDMINDDVEAAGRYWGRQDLSHLVIMDSITSEKMRTSYLYALAWIFSKAPQMETLALWCSYQTFPIDLGLWKLLPSRSPYGLFDQPAAMNGSIDVVPATVRNYLETYLSSLTEQEYLLASASGRINCNDSIYDLEVFGTLQKSRSEHTPSPEDVYNDVSFARHVSIYNDCIDVDNEKIESQESHDDSNITEWEIIPLFSRLNIVPRWQYWRAQRGIFVPNLDIFTGEVTVKVDNDKISYLDCDGEIGFFYDWTCGIPERIEGNLTPDCGCAMFVSHEKINHLLNDRYRYCLVYKLTNFSRKYDFHGEFLKNVFFDYVGHSQIIVP